MKGLGVYLSVRMSSFNTYYRQLPALSPLVRQHLPSVEWLVSTRAGDRRTGRTTTLSMAFLRESFSNMSFGQIRVFDHLIPDDESGSTSRQWVVQKIREMGVAVSNSGIMENGPSHAADRDSPSFPATLQNVSQDFRDLVGAAVRLGIDPEWMISYMRSALAEAVMST